MNNFPKINYIGNKEKIAAWICNKLPISEGVVLDLFAGGGSMSYYLKSLGFKVISNDALYSSYVINKALVENSSIVLEDMHILNALESNINYAIRSDLDWLVNNLYFKDEVDELSKLVAYSFKLETYEMYIFKALIRRAMIRKIPYSRMNVNWNNIIKLRDEEYSYRKYKRRRAYHNKSFSYHMLKDLSSYNDAIFNNRQDNIAFQYDALDMLDKIDYVDLIYLDPPYPGTMNKYSDFYGSFDRLFDKEISHTDITNSKDFIKTFKVLMDKAICKCSYIVLSLNVNIKPDYKSIIALAKNYGNIEIKKRKHDYKLTGKENKNTNKELLIIVSKQ